MNNGIMVPTWVEQEDNWWAVNSSGALVSADSPKPCKLRCSFFVSRLCRAVDCGLGCSLPFGPHG